LHRLVDFMPLHGSHWRLLSIWNFMLNRDPRSVHNILHIVPPSRATMIVSDLLHDFNRYLEFL
jgi:hypothetical protein